MSNKKLHILVPVKRVIDHNIKIRVKADGSAVETAGVKMSINPFDEVALEQAIRLREQGVAERVTAITFGTTLAQDVLRTSLALGADVAVLVETADVLEPLGVARLLKASVQQESVDLVFCGKQDIDDDLGATGPMLAGLLDWPQAVSVNQLAIDAGTLNITCDADSGVERLSLPCPAVLSVDLRLCEPRHITLPAMMRAKKGAIQTVVSTNLAKPGEHTIHLVSVSEPIVRKPGIRLDGVDALLARLRTLPVLQGVE